MDNEKRFYNALPIVPEIPAGILEKVERQVNRNRTGTFRRALLAACLAFALIIPALTLIKTGASPSAAYADGYDPMGELLFAFEYVNGEYDGEFLFDDDQFISLTDNMDDDGN